MKKNINFLKYSLQSLTSKTFVLAAMLLLSLPTLSHAATYMYVNNMNSLQTIEADNSTIAMLRAPNIALHSGVILLSSPYQVGMDTSLFRTMINNLSVDTNNTSAVVKWDTTVNTSASIYYSTNPLVLTEATNGSSINISGTKLIANSDLRTSHFVNLTELQQNSTYYYVIDVKDGFGNESITWPSSFKTK